ncbi:MAG: CapA family protein [Dorea sp.]|nr:CapA family protein [Dorea sp.]
MKEKGKKKSGIRFLYTLIAVLIVAGGAFAAKKFLLNGDSHPGKIAGNPSAYASVEGENDISTEITVSLTGDFILGTDEAFDWDSGFNAYYERYGGPYFLENVRDVFEKDDLTIINFECTLTEETARENKQFAFKGDPAFVDVLTSSSVEGANTANNHSHDYGEKSYTDTLDILEKNGIQTVGYDKVSIFEVKGMKIGVFGIYELDDHLARIPQMEENIIKLKEAGADIIIGIFHWSNELETSPDLNARTLAHLAIDEGVDLVIGHHPHILQGVETYKGKHIAYSLGNFCFGGNTHPKEFDTVIYQETFKVEHGKLTGSEMNLIPTCISSNWEFNDYKPTIMTGEEGEKILKKIKDRSDEIILDFTDPKPQARPNAFSDSYGDTTMMESSEGYTDEEGYTYTENPDASLWVDPSEQTGYGDPYGSGQYEEELYYQEPYYEEAYY